MSDILGGLVALGVVAALTDGDGEEWNDAVGQRFKKASEDVVADETKNVEAVCKAVAENSDSLQTAVLGLGKETADELKKITSAAEVLRNELVQKMDPEKLYLQSEKLKRECAEKSKAEKAKAEAAKAEAAKAEEAKTQKGKTGK